MTLDEYRKKEDLTIEAMARFLGFTTNKTFRLCKGAACIKLVDAQVIVIKTAGAVGFADLQPDECA